MEKIITHYSSPFPHHCSQNLSSTTTSGRALAQAARRPLPTSHQLLHTHRLTQQAPLLAGVLPLLSLTSYSRRENDTTVVSIHNFDIFSGEGRKMHGGKSTLVPDGLKDESFYITPRIWVQIYESSFICYFQ